MFYRVRGIIEYYAANGGIVNGAIFAVAVATIHIGLGKLAQFRRLRAMLRTGRGTTGRPGERIAPFFRPLLHEERRGAKYYRNQLTEILLGTIPRVTRGLDTMAALVSAAPLLGLFGTVVGMIETFSLITKYGTANPVILTEGITVSLLTTQAGLLVAFPCLLFHNHVKGRMQRLVRDIMAEGEALVAKLSVREGSSHA
jgi:biopolymer transport protein ExbB